MAGLVVALALIPEAVTRSISAGADPKVGLCASFSNAVIIAINGGRPGMILAAPAATAVRMVTLVKDHGLQGLLAATGLADLIKIGAGLMRPEFVSPLFRGLEIHVVTVGTDTDAAKKGLDAASFIVKATGYPRRNRPPAGPARKSRLASWWTRHSSACF